MELSQMKGPENVRTHRADICRALGVELVEEMVTNDYFLGRFYGEDRDFLDSLGLINRGFCPLCGVEPIGSEYKRGLVFSKAVEHLCKDCYDRMNPHLTTPGYTRRYYTAKVVLWLLGLGVVYVLFLLVRGCVNLLR